MRLGDEGGADPLASPHDGLDNDNEALQGRGDNTQGNGGQASIDEVMGEDAGKLDEVRSDRAVNRSPQNATDAYTSPEKRPKSVYGRRFIFSTDKGSAKPESTVRWVRRRERRTDETMVSPKVCMDLGVVSKEVIENDKAFFLSKRG